MGRRHTPAPHARAPEGYYEDEDEDEAALGDDEVEGGRARLRQRLVAVLGTSYGLSALVHLAILAVLATIVLAGPPPERVAVIAQRPPLQLPPPPRDLKPAVETQLPVDTVLEAERTLVDLVDEPEPVDIPRGTDLSNQANKQTQLDARQVVDAFGPGPGAAGAYGRPDRKGRAKGLGASDAGLNAVLKALLWLADHQGTEGAWSCAGWQARCSRGRCKGPGFDAGSEHYDVGVTALATLAFLGDGHTHRFSELSKFRNVVRGALRWLAAQQADDGSVGFQPGHGETIYGHAIATMALCEAYGITRDPLLRRPAERALAFCLAAQNPGLGWRYGVRPGQNDTSVTGWFVLALKAARTAGLEVPDAAFDGGRAWLVRATGTTPGDAGYMSPGGGSSFLPGNEGRAQLPVNPGVAALCRVLLGDRRSDDAIRGGLKLLAQEPPTATPERTNYYYWYYGTYAMFQAGGDAWPAWNAAMLKATLGTMRTGGCEDGSWDGVDEWSVAGGRVYATAINALTLEIYYRYERAKEGAGPGK